MKSTIEELQVFTVIVDSGSIVKAAERLDQTASGISRALQRLESKLNVTLLERTTRKIKLTQEGQLFLAKTRRILNDLTEAEDSLLKLDADTSGLVRVDSAISFILHVIVPLIPEFNARYPHIQIELVNHDQVIDLLEHKADVAIRFGKLNDSEVRINNAAYIHFISHIWLAVSVILSGVAVQYLLFNMQARYFWTNIETQNSFLQDFQKPTYEGVVRMSVCLFTFAFPTFIIAYIFQLILG